MYVQTQSDTYLSPTAIEGLQNANGYDGTAQEVEVSVMFILLSEEPDKLTLSAI